MPHRRALPIVLAFALVALATVPASARTRVFVGLNFGFPCCAYYPAPYAYYPYPAYYPPAYYYPPPYYYYPPPVAYYPPAATAAAPQCREWRGDARNEQTGQTFYGTACLMPDGRWHIVNQY